MLALVVNTGLVRSGFYPSHPGGPDAFDWLVIVVGVVVIFAVIVAISIPFARAAERRAVRQPPTLIMQFRVGVREVHSVEIEYGQAAAWLTVKVDGQQTLSRSFITALKLAQTIEWQVGSSERHIVGLTKTRLRWYAQARPQQFVATVDGVVVAQGESRPFGHVPPSP